MNVFKKTVFVVFILIIVIIIVSLLVPAKMKVSRSVIVKTPVKQVFQKVHHLPNWESWSPWYELDPEMELSYWNIVQGEGAGYCWVSEQVTVGKGCISIIESYQDQSIKTFLDLTTEGKGTVDGVWLFESFMNQTENDSLEEGVLVTWTLEKDISTPFVIGKYQSFFWEDRMGTYLEKGLLNLKQISEREWLNVESGIQLVDLLPQNILSIVDTCEMDDIGDKLRELFTELSIFMSLKEVESRGQPLTIYHIWEPENEVTVIEAAIPVFSDTISVSGRIMNKKMPLGKAAMATHYGAFSESDKMHRLIEEWIDRNGKTVSAPYWETYVTDPTIETDTAKWETKIYYPVSD